MSPKDFMTVQNSHIVELIEEAKTVGRQLCHLSSQLGCGTDVVTERGQDGRDHANDSHIGRVWLQSLLPELDSDAKKLSCLAEKIRGQ